MSNIVHAYTDSSFSKEFNIAVCGYSIFYNSDNHKNISLCENKISLSYLTEKNNIRGEIRGAINVLENCPLQSKVYLYTDCQCIVGLLSRREKLEANNFISKNKRNPLANLDLYKEFYKLSDQVNLKVVWLKGHTTGYSLTLEEKNFSFLDKAVRKYLRELINSK